MWKGKSVGKRIASLLLAFAMVLTQLGTWGAETVKADTTRTSITLTNADFETYIWNTDGTQGWSVSVANASGASDWDSTTTSNGSSDSVTGTFNFWRKNAGTITLTQSVALEAGTYQMGADVYGGSATVSFVLSGTAETTERTISSSSSNDTVTGDEFSLTAGGDVTVGVQLNLEAGGWGYLDNVTLTKVADTTSVTVTADKTTVTTADTVTLTAALTIDGMSVTDFTADTYTDYNLWWWEQNSTSGVTIATDTKSGKDLTKTVTFTAAGTYDIVAQLKKGDTEIKQTVTTVTVTEATSSGDDNDNSSATTSVTVTPSSTTVQAGDSVDLTATVTVKGTEITDLSTSGYELWWWTDSWNSHSDGNGDAEYKYATTESTHLTQTVTFPTEGTYYIVAEITIDGTKYTPCATITVKAKEQAATAVEGDLNIDKVENLSDDFIMGMDISSVMSEFASGVTYKDDNGNTIDNITDFCKYLASKGITHIRVRVWNDPYDSNKKGYGGGNNDVATAKTIADACRSAGLKMLVDFHCSDFWTDPDKQQAPKAWASMTLEEKEAALKTYITDSLNTIDPDKDTVTMVQIGNETTTAFIGETTVANMCALFSAGSAGVDAYSDSVKVVIHVTNPNKGYLTTWAKNLSDNNVDYDILATSYYPYWHGSLSNLKSEFATVKSTYGKDVMVAETSYAYTLDDSDGHDNTVREGKNDTGDDLKQPFTVQGQATAIRNLIETVSDAGGLGVFYWEPAWITVGDTTGLTGDAYDAQVAANKTKWETYGSGWASSYSASYDPEDAGQWYGGSAVDNEAMFYPDGTPTAAIEVWNAVKTGMYTSKVSVDDIADAEITVEQNKTYTLPQTLTVSYNTGDVNETVTWDTADLAAVDVMNTGTYTVSGTVTFSKEVTLGLYNGKTSGKTTCTITVIAPNLITDADDAGFENASGSFTASGSGIQSVSDSETPYAGSYCMHWYSATAAEGIVTYNKTITLEAGNYVFEAEAQGYAGDTVTLRVLDESGTELFTGDAEEMNGWKNWTEPSVTFALAQETTIKLQIFVDMQVGGWGTADCMYLHVANTANTSTSSGSSHYSGSSTSTSTSTAATNTTATDTTVKAGTTETSVSAVDTKGNAITADVTVTTDETGAVTEATAEATATEKKISGDLVAQIIEAAGTDDVELTVTVTDTDGNTKYTVTANAADLTEGTELKVFAWDEETGEYKLVNAKTYEVKADGTLSVSLKDGQNYVLLTTAEAKSVEKAILKTVKAKKTSTTTKKGKTTKFKFSSKLDMDNVKKITYKSTKKSVVKITKSGKIVAKKKGTATVKAVVTLKNGTKKTVKMKVKVK